VVTAGIQTNKLTILLRFHPLPPNVRGEEVKCGPGNERRLFNETLNAQ